MLSRIRTALVALVLLILAGTPVTALGPQTLGADCGGSLACMAQDNWVCCSLPVEECEQFTVNKCNLVEGEDPFDQVCGWPE